MAKRQGLRSCRFRFRRPRRGPDLDRTICLNDPALRLEADWHLDADGPRCHYVVEAWLGRARIGRAYGWFEPGAEFVLEKIEVNAARRSKGYGTSIIECLRAKARECGCQRLVIGGVRADNRGAIRLYEALGAVPLARASTLRTYVISPP